MEGNFCINDCKEEKRGQSREGATIVSSSLPDRRCFEKEGASAVGEVGQEDPIVGSGEKEATEGMLVTGEKNEVMGAEGSN